MGCRMVFEPRSCAWRAAFYLLPQKLARGNYKEKRKQYEYSSMNKIFINVNITLSLYATLFSVTKAKYLRLSPYKEKRFIQLTLLWLSSVRLLVRAPRAASHYGTW